MKFRLGIFVHNFIDATIFVSAKPLEKMMETADKGLTSAIDLLESKCFISTERLDL